MAGVQTTDGQNIINKTSLDTAGTLTLSGRDLPPHKMLYRLALQKSDTTLSISSGPHKNYIHVVLDNTTDLHIEGCDPFTRRVANCTVIGNPESEIIQRIYDEMLPKMMEEQLEMYKIKGKTKEDFLQKKHIDIFKGLADTCRYLIPSVMSLELMAPRDLFNKALEADPDYFDRFIKKIKKLDPDHPYTLEMINKIEQSKREIFGENRDLSAWYLPGLAALCLLLLLHNLRLRSQMKSLRTTPALVQHSASSLSSRLDRLSPKEKEVFELMRTGMSNKEIASQLFIETTTVKSHISKIYQKLQISSRKEISQFLDNQGPTT